MTHLAHQILPKMIWGVSLGVLLILPGRIRLIYLGYGWREEDVAAEMARLLQEG